MKIQKIISFVVGFSQIALAIALFFFPDQFFSIFHFSQAQSDQKYLFGQLAARFLAYGIGMFFIMRNPAKHILWWNLMTLIQALDFIVGTVYVLAFNVSIELAWFPMMNALVFALALLFFRPKAEK